MPVLSHANSAALPRWCQWDVFVALAVWQGAFHSNIWQYFLLENCIDIFTKGAHTLTKLSEEASNFQVIYLIIGDPKCHALWC